MDKKDIRDALVFASIILLTAYIFGVCMDLTTEHIHKSIVLIIALVVVISETLLFVGYSMRSICIELETERQNL